MKKAFQSKFVWALIIVVVAGSIVYLTTWGNKDWLIQNIIDKGGVPDSKEAKDQLALKTAAQLRSQLKGLI